MGLVALFNDHRPGHRRREGRGRGGMCHPKCLNRSSGPKVQNLTALPRGGGAVHLRHGRDGTFEVQYFFCQIQAIKRQN